MQSDVIVQTASLEAEASAQPQCTHHWLIDPPSGPTSRGRCKRCGEERFFINSTADWVWDGQSAKDLGGLEAARPKAHDDWQESA